MLPSDVSKPIGIVLNRLSDPRVEQFWDADHVLSARMAQDARKPQPAQRCCLRNNHLWDLAAIYRVGVTWDTQMPTATVFDGPVLYVEKQIREGIAFKE
jgi:hypothetical protein